MKNNELIEYKVSFVSKIKNFFKRLFRKEENSIEKETSYFASNNQDVNTIEENKFLNNIRVEQNETIYKVNKKEIFLENINGNREALNMLSMDRLINLSQYYAEIIENNNKMINKLKKSV